MVIMNITDHLDMCILASLEAFPRTLFLPRVTWMILIVPDWRLGGLGQSHNVWLIYEGLKFLLGLGSERL